MAIQKNINVITLSKSELEKALAFLYKHKLNQVTLLNENAGIGDVTTVSESLSKNKKKLKKEDITDYDLW